MQYFNPMDPFGTNSGGWPSYKGVRRPRPPEPESLPPEDEPTAEMIIANTWRPEVKPEKPKATLSEPGWVEPETFFHEEAEVQVRLTLPEGKGHLTRVKAVLRARGFDGQDIFTGEGYAGEDGIARITLPMFKPQGYQSGTVDYYTLFMHVLADPLDTEFNPRTVEKTKLKAADHALVPGPAFPKDSSFISPRATAALKTLEKKLKSWERKTPKKTKIVVFGHADTNEADGKALSERRAQSAHAFITNDADTWEKLYTLEKWGLAALQELLKDLGHYGGKLNGQDDAPTRKAFKAFQKKAILPETGQEDSATRKALFAAYMKGKHDIKIDAAHFRLVAGNPWMGCGANNRVKESEGPTPENRRVAFVLLRESKYFPPNFPCQDGNEKPCQFQCKNRGPRSAPGIGCMYYDELIREETQEFCEAAPQGEPEPITYEEAQKVAFYVTGNYETIGCDYSAVTGNFDGAGISFGAMQWNTKWGTLQTLLKAFEAEDRPLFEKCFDNDAEALKRIREVMNEKQTADRQKPFPDGMKWATEEVHEWDGHRATWKGDWKKRLAALGAQEKFRAVELREGIKHNKDGTEDKITWLKGKSPGTWSKVSLRSYCALFDLTNQIGRTGPELRTVESEWCEGIPKTQAAMVQDFIKIVCNKKLGESDDTEGFIERRQGILYAGYCDTDVTPGYAKPRRRKNVEDLVGREKFIQDYPGG